MALFKAEKLAGQFRKSEADEPRVFAASWAAVMADFPPCVLDHVCHPATGLAIQQNFMPTVFEVREACIAHFAYLIAKWKLDAIPPEKRISAPRTFKIDEPREIRKTKDELLAKYGPNFGLGGNDDTRAPSNYRVPSIGEIIAHYTKNKTLGIPLHRPMKGYDDNGQGNKEGVLADTVTAGGEGDLAERQDAPEQAGSEDAPRGTRSVGIEASLEESPPPREEGDPGYSE